MNNWKTELRTLFQMEDMPTLESFIQALLDTQREEIRKEVDRLYSRWDGKADTQFLMELDSIISGLTPDKTEV